jgi:hypothetical protein
VNSTIDGVQHAIEHKFPKPFEMKEYKMVFGGGFTGYIGSAIVCKKTGDHPLFTMMADHQNMNLKCKADLSGFEQSINPKRNRKQFLTDVALILTPLATSTFPQVSIPGSCSSNHVVLDLVNPRRRIECLGEIFVWFKTSKNLDFDKLGGFNAFIMLLSLISSLA